MECHLKFYKSSLNSNTNITTYKELNVGVWEPAVVAFGGFF